MVINIIEKYTERADFMLKDNLHQVQQNIKAACDRAHRNYSDVTLIAVSKTKPVEMLSEIYDEGIREFGENKVQEMCEKMEVMPKDIHWQVNIAGEESKFGTSQDEAISLVEEIAKLDHIHIKGLMTIAPFVDDPEDNRQYFRDIKQLSVDIAKKNIDNVSMNVLSMGMTGDYTVAIEEGATMVRVGTGIFGERDYSKAN